jgi:hypothetical protein
MSASIGSIIGIVLLLFLFLKVLFIIGLIILFINIIFLIIIIVKKRRYNTNIKKLPLILSIIGIIVGISLQLPYWLFLSSIEPFKILFIIGLIILFVNIIFLIVIIVKKRRYNTNIKKLPLILSIIGIIVGISLQLPYWIKMPASDIEPNEIIDTGVNVYWENMKNSESKYADKYFIYNNKTYVRLTGILASYMEIDEPIANIKSEEADRGDLIYTIKGCNDLSLLIVKNGIEFVYCDIGLTYEKHQYFDDAGNYNLFIARTYIGLEERYEITNRPLLKNDYDIMEHFKFNYSDDYIHIPRRENNELIGYEYINIYGSSHDGMVKKKVFKNFLIYNDNIYTYTNRVENYLAAKLTDEEEKYILSLLK